MRPPTRLLGLHNPDTQRDDPDLVRSGDMQSSVTFPRVLMAIEAGSTKVHVESLEKLLSPFGYQVGVVRSAE
jgi:hypothetical protein